MTPAPRLMNFQPVVPQVPTDTRDQNPTAVRYGFCPFKDINLVNGDGTVCYYVQPEKITDENGDAVDNPFHRTLPKNQLIPFETFMIQRKEAVSDPNQAPGSPGLLRTVSETKTAHDAATELMPNHGGWGYVVLHSLRGIAQATAFKIFQRVLPFDTPMGKTQESLDFEAFDRIELDKDLHFPYAANQPDYIVPALSASEKITAHLLLEELKGSIEVALRHANDTLDATEAAMSAKFSGGIGKAGADAHDRYLAEETGRVLPQFIGGKEKQGINPDFERKLDYLVGKEQDREKDIEIARLKAELEAAKSQPNFMNEVCVGVNTKGEPCKGKVVKQIDDGFYCASHPKE